MAAPLTREAHRATALRLAEHLTEDEFRRLSWFKGTYEAAAHLKRAGLVADRDAARHLAFGLWLKATGRLDGELTRDDGRAASRPADER